MFLYIIFRYALVDIRDALWRSGNATMDGAQWSMFNWNMQSVGDGFGMAGLVIFFLAILFFLFDVFSSPGREMY